VAGTFLIVLYFFIVNVALPSMQARLHAGASMLEWVVAGYGLTFAVLPLAASRIGDLWGRRSLFMVGIGLFTVTSAACGLAPTVGDLVAARLAQGAAGALIAPTALGSIGALFHGTDRARAIGIYSTVMGLAAAGGQLIGGLLLSADLFGTGWRAVFLINLPVGVAALVLAPPLVPETRGGTHGRIDLLGLVLATGGLTVVVLPLLEGRSAGWPVWTWASLTLAPVLLLAFRARQRRPASSGGSPLLDLVTLFESQTFLLSARTTAGGRLTARDPLITRRSGPPRPATVRWPCRRTQPALSAAAA
jgi:MFS family permease